MSKTKFTHTPGPWRVENHTESVGPYTSAALEIWSNNRHITTVNEHVEDLAVDQANAALISAAPEMFEALEIALGYLPDVKFDDVFFRDQIEGILKKARGVKP